MINKSVSGKTSIGGIGTWVLIIIILGGIFIIVNADSVEAKACGQTFIDMANYNVCYTPNVALPNSLNITTNNNDTLVSYHSSTSSSNGVVFPFAFYMKFGNLQNYSNIYFFDFNGTDNKNTSVKGSFYFSDNFITINEERTMSSNQSFQERITWDNYNVSGYLINKNTSIFNNNLGGNSPYKSAPTIKHITNSINYTIQGWVFRILVNQSLENQTIKDGVNMSIYGANAGQVWNYSGTSNLGGLEDTVDFRTSNLTEMTVINRDANNQIKGLEWLYNSLYIFAFQESYFNQSSKSQLINGTDLTFQTGLTGRTVQMDDSCANTTLPTTLLFSCRSNFQSEHDLQSYFLYSKVNNDLWSRNDFDTIKIFNLERLYMNRTNPNLTFVSDYNFNYVNGNPNYFNNTHTRHIGDYLMDLVTTIQDKNAIINETINTLINYIQSPSTKINNSYDSSLISITHSTMSTPFVDNLFVVNTHAGATAGLLSAYESNYSVNKTLLDQLVNTMIKIQPFMFNNSNTARNQSYYSLGSDGNYFPDNMLGSLTYVDYSIYNYRQVYLYNKSEELRNITRIEIDELKGDYNANTNTYSGGLSWNQNFSVHSIYGHAKYLYQNLTITAFNVTQSYNPNKVNSLNPQLSWGWDKIPNGVKFINIYYPVFLATDNTTYYIDKENNLLFQTPPYAMIPDMQSDKSQKGFKIWIKWAFATSGNFTNLSTSPYKYIYDPQNQKFINYSEQQSYSATNSEIIYWMGNLSTSTKFTLNETNSETHLLIDNLDIGQLNKTIWFSNTSNNFKSISSNLTEDINATVNVNVSQIVGAINSTTHIIHYNSHSGKYNQTINTTQRIFNQNDLTLTFNLTGIEPALASNNITLNTPPTNPIINSPVNDIFATHDLDINISGGDDADSDPVYYGIEISGNSSFGPGSLVYAKYNILKTSNASIYGNVANLDNGNYYIRALSDDLASNSSYSQTRQFTINVASGGGGVSGGGNTDYGNQTAINQTTTDQTTTSTPITKFSFISLFLFISFIIIVIIFLKYGGRLISNA